MLGIRKLSLERRSLGRGRGQDKGEDEEQDGTATKERRAKSLNQATSRPTESRSSLWEWEDEALKPSFVDWLVMPSLVAADKVSSS